MGQCLNLHCLYNNPDVAPPTSCTNPHCGIDKPRCPVCEHTFVEAPQVVCDYCPHICDDCSVIVDKLIEISPQHYVCYSCFNSTENQDKFVTHRERIRKQQEENLSQQRCGIHGCTNVFVPTMPGQNICEDCKEKIDAGICPSCEEAPVLGKAGLDEGLKMCNHCVDFYYKERYAMADVNPYFRHKCACGSYRSSFEGEICDLPECREAYQAKLCPNCNQNLIRNGMFICYPCLKTKSYKYDKREYQSQR